jgi:hypothetical protein
MKSLSNWSAESSKVVSFGFYVAVPSCCPLIAQKNEVFIKLTKVRQNKGVIEL